MAAVAWSHWERDYQFGLPFGAGVHLFYVLSGFLITRILLEIRHGSDHGAALRAFYIRRGLRLMPAFYLTLTLAWLAGAVPATALAWHATYLSNVLIFSTAEWQGSLSHLWSLAVEEQFYLVWPWIVLFVPGRWLVPVMVAAVVSAPVFRWTLAVAGYRETLHAVLTPGSMDSLGVGALLAVAVRAQRHAVFADPRVGLGAFALWAALLAAGAALPPWAVAAKQTVQAVVFAWLVCRAFDGFDGVAGRLLAAAPVVYVGRISYGVYLAHGLAGVALAALGVSSRAIPEPLRFVVLVVVTVGLASLSWHLLEAPVNRLKSRFPYLRAARRDNRATVGSS